MRKLAYLFVLLICCEAKYVPEDGVYAVSETMPTYEKGEAALNQFVRQQVETADIQATGSVFVSFVVTTEGEISKINILNGVNEELDAKAVSIVSGIPGRWIPGTEEGEPVEVKMVYPIRF